MTTRLLLLGIVVPSLAVSCAEPGPERVPLTQTNDLHAVAIQLDRFDDHNDHVFELRGLDANDNEVALVRLRTGQIADIGDYLPSANLDGSELIVTALGSTKRMLSHELNTHIVALPSADPKLRQLLELPTVAAALQNANIVIQTDAGDDAERVHHCELPVSVLEYDAACEDMLLEP